MKTTPRKNTAWKKRLSLLLSIALIIQLAVVVPIAFAKDLSSSSLVPTLKYDGVVIGDTTDPNYFKDLVFTPGKKLETSVIFEVLTYADVYTTIYAGLMVALGAAADGSSEKADVQALIDGLSTGALLTAPSNYNSYYGGGDVPVYAVPGDTFTFNIPDFFLPETDSDRPGVTLDTDGRTLGTFTYGAPDNGIVAVTFTFNPADDDINNPIYPGPYCISDFRGKFSTEKIVNSAAELVIALNKFKLADSDFNFELPVPVDTYTLTKTGAQPVDKEITWTLAYTGKTDNVTANLDAAGHKFSDDLTNVGKYVGGSLVVTDKNNTDITSSLTERSADTAATLSFKLPAGTETPVNITFKTELDPNIVYDSDNYHYSDTLKGFASTITNAAEFEDADENPTAEAEEEVTFKTSIVTKTGVPNNTESFDKDPNGNGGNSGYSGGEDTKRYMIWTITANSDGYHLTNACIDELMDYSNNEDSEKLTFVEAIAYKYVSGSWVEFKHWGDSHLNPMPSSPGSNGIHFDLGTIDFQVILKIKAMLPPDSDPAKGVEYDNTATIHWEDFPGVGGRVLVDTGYNALTKTGTRVTTGTVTEKTQDIKWNISATAYGETGFPDFAVYDLLIYGNTYSNIGLPMTPPEYGVYKLSPNASLTAVTNNTDKSTDDILAFVRANGIGASLNHKYVNGTFTSSNLDLSVFTVKDSDGNAVADLLVMTPIAGDGSTLPFVGTNGRAHGTFTASFNSKCLRPATFLNTATAGVSHENTATLYTGDMMINKATATVNFGRSTVGKFVFTVSKAKAYVEGGFKLSDIPTSALSADNQKLAFDYYTRSTMYMLHINMSEADLTDSSKYVADTKSIESLGPVTVKDTLPKGWALIPGGKLGTDIAFKLYDIVTGTIVDPDDYDEILVAGTDGKFYTHTLNSDGNYELIFTFKKLTSRYFLVFEAGMTEETYKNYFSDNKSTRVNTHRNNVSMVAGGVAFTSEATITIPDMLLKKSVKPSADKSTIDWTVTYDPKAVDVLDQLRQSGYTGPVPLELTDTMSPYIVPFYKTVAGNIVVDTDKFTITEYTGHNPDGSPNTPRIMTPDEVKDCITLEFDIANGNWKVIFAIPKPTYTYVLEYSTELVAEKPGLITNNIALSGYTKTEEETGATFELSKAYFDSQMTSLASFTILKVDATGAPIPGVRFTLYDSDGVAVRSILTGDDGKAPVNMLKDNKYGLQETFTPPEYIPDNTKTSIDVENKNVTVGGDEFHKFSNGTLTVINQIAEGYGQLKIGKTITGNQSSADDEFVFTITFEYPRDNEPSDGTFFPCTITHSSGSTTDGAISTDGDTITLMGGESVLITGIPKDTKCTVTETGTDYTTSYSIKGTASVTGLEAKLAIENKAVVDVQFTNHKHVTTGGPFPTDPPEESPDESDDPGTPDDPDDPPDESDNPDNPDDPDDPDRPTPTPPVSPPGGNDPATPPTPTNPGNTLEPEGDTFVEYDEDGVPLGIWTYDEELEEWVFEEFIPLSDFPTTGDSTLLIHWVVIALTAATLIALIAVPTKKREN